MESGTRDRLRAIGTFVAELEAPGFEAGRWHRSEITRREGDTDIWTMPWFELSDRASAFVSTLAGIMVVFDWPTWARTDEAQTLHDDRQALSTATYDQLTKLATAVIREDRFNEGALAASLESGLMAAIARRAAALADGP
ncbi:MAG TPA: DUF6508 domain-containing protein [Candidatus Limnocylindrales bacterium]|nr:DUF6508 domain-containing protein [Candidatus Limnocylindrales bacterium]